MKNIKNHYPYGLDGTSRKWKLPIYLYILCAMTILSCTKEQATQEHPILAATALKAKSETLNGQLKKVKKIAMRFHSFQQAKKMGYAEPLPFNPSPYVPQMGYHYTNLGLLDAEFELERPEILLYVPNEQGKLKLVAVEYAVPVALSENPPEGFIGDDDHWEYNPNVAGGAWTLHVWTVLENPDGIFESFNPLVPLTDPSIN